MSTRQHKLPPALGDPPFATLEEGQSMLDELNGRSVATPAEHLELVHERAHITAWLSVLRTSPNLREKLLA